MSDWKSALIFFPIAFALCLGGWVLQSSFEARAYERATGFHVSTWDAMFIELRVQAPPRSEPSR